MKIGKKNIPTWIVASLAVLLVAGAGVLIWAWPYLMTGSPAEGIVKIRKGSSLEMVRDSLKMHVDEQFGETVYELLCLTKSDLTGRHGAFTVKEGDSPYTVLRLLRSGAPCGLKVTLSNVRTKKDFAARVGKKLLMSSDEMLAALNDSALCAKFGKTTDNIMAMLQPDTYEFYWDLTPEELLETMKHYYDQFWTDERVAQAKQLGFTPEEVVTIGSIVEEETAKKDERGQVARLYINRVKQGMPLQADPTVKFALGDFAIRRISIEMTRTPSPYNTYYIKGLPPGPIRLVEKETLESVLNAPENSYIFMCAREDFSGYHNFATTYSEHQANAARYQKALNERGIKVGERKGDKKDEENKQQQDTTKQVPNK